MNNEISIRTDESGTIRIPLSQIKSVKSKPDHDKETDHEFKENPRK